ncbi:MAG: DUF2283 domain-containing protein [Thermodesulfobacteriota bacterium]
MNKPKLTYHPEQDTLHLAISDEEESGSFELAPHVTAELNDQGELIGIEILEASSFLANLFMETAQAKMLDLQRPRDQDREAQRDGM